VNEVKHPELVAAAVTTALAKMVKAAGDEARAKADGVLDEGASVTLYSPLGAKLGKALVTDPEATAVVTDRNLLNNWLVHTYPDQVETVEAISPNCDAVMAVLEEHAPELIVRITRPIDRMVPDVLAASAEAGQPMGPDGELDVPGVAVNKKPGVLHIRLDAKTAPQAVADMWVAGLIGLDGTLRELEGSE
jgi:hypothetical protein